MCAKLNSKYFTDEQFKLLKRYGIPTNTAIFRHKADWNFNQILGIEEPPGRKVASKYFTNEELRILEENFIPLYLATRRAKKPHWSRRQVLGLDEPPKQIKTRKIKGDVVI